MPPTLRLARLASFACLAAIPVVLGCSSAHDPPPPAKELPCDVVAVLQNVCQRCHGSPPSNQAPFPLVTYADTQIDVSGRPLWTFMLSALQNGRMPLPPVDLAQADRDVLLAWLSSNAPAREAGASCTSPASP